MDTPGMVNLKHDIMIITLTRHVCNLSTDYTNEHVKMGT